MIQGLVTAEFIFLCSIQLFAMGFSLVLFVNSLKRYFRTDRSEVFMRKTVKYLTFIFISVALSCFFSLFVEIFYVITADGNIAGYLYGSITTSAFVIAFCSWQFVTYLIHPERRKTKYPIGTYVLIGIIIQWFSFPIITNVMNIPEGNLLAYGFLAIIYIFVYSFFTYEFFKHSRKSESRTQKIRFRTIGLSAIFSILMFPLGLLPHGLIFSWIVVLISTILLYLGFNFPKFFQRWSKV